MQSCYSAQPMEATARHFDTNTPRPVITEAEDLTRVFKALADPLRLDILRLLRTESFGVLELCRIVDVRQSALSHHLKILAQAALVSTRREVGCAQGAASRQWAQNARD